MKLDAALRLVQPARPADPPVSFFEFWPSWLFYGPVIAHCIAMAVRFRSPLALAAANPTITAGGLCGELKLDILDQVGPEAHPLLARYTSLTTHEWNAHIDLAAAEDRLTGARLGYPIVAKPDIGCNGTGVRLIRGPADLFRYLAAFPRKERLLLQEYVPDRGKPASFTCVTPMRRSGASPRSR